MEDGPKEPIPAARTPQGAGLQQMAAFHDSIPPGGMGAASAAATRESTLFVWNTKDRLYPIMAIRDSRDEKKQAWSGARRLW